MATNGKGDRQLISLQIGGVPPVKQAGISCRKDNDKRRKMLKDAALRIARDTPYPLYGNVKVRLTVNYVRTDGRLDAANIVGGIADALQGIFYEDDRQLAQIAYAEEARKKSKDSYEITLGSVQG